MVIYNIEDYEKDVVKRIKQGKTDKQICDFLSRKLPYHGSILIYNYISDIRKRKI